jgi:hypothetical protein
VFLIFKKLTAINPLCGIAEGNVSQHEKNDSLL